jgi:hypothetical protein
MSSKSLERQADRAERLADRTVDGKLKATLLEAAKEYRAQAERHEDPLDPLHASAPRPTWLGLGDGHSEQLRAKTGF